MGTNWIAGTAPVANNSLAFNNTTGTTTLTNDITAATQFNGITFNSGASAYTLTGNQITLGGSVTNNSANLQTLSLPLALSATQTFNAASGGLTLSGSISGAGGLTKTGSGTLNVSGSQANTYSGATTVSAGILNLNKTAGATAIPGSLAISNARVTFGTNNQVADSAAVTMSGTSSIFNGATYTTGIQAALDETIGSLAVTGGVFFPGGATSVTGFTVTGSASFTGGAGNTEYTQNSGGLASFGSLSLTAMTSTSAALGSFVGNRFVLGGNSTSRQSTLTVGSGGLSLDGSNLLLQLGGAGALGSRLVLNGDVTTTGNAASSIRAPTTDNSIGGRAVELSSTSGTVTRTFTIGGGGANLTVSIPIANGSATSAGITKAGVGTLTLGTANTYTGTTTISAGTLALDSAGSFATSTRITVGNAGSSGAVLDLTAKTGTFAFASSQTVGGIGTINIGAGQTVSSAGIWAPGNSIGSNAVTGNLALSGTSQFELGTPGTGNSAPGLSDFTAVSGTLTLGGALTLLDNAGADGNGSAAGGVYRLFTYGSAVSGSYASVTANPTAATRTSLSQITYGGSGTAAGQGVFLSLYNLASAASTQTVSLGNFRVGDTATKGVVLTNTAPANATYTETLGSGSFSSTSSGYTATGSVTGIQGLQSGSGSLVVGFSTTSAGARSGSTVLSLNSEAVNGSGFGTTGVGTQTITITGSVYNPAAANRLPATVTLGNIRVGSAFGTQSLSIWNTGSAATAFQEGLNASIASTDGSASGTGSITNLYVAGGTSTALSVGLGAGTQATAGVVSGTATIGFATNGTLSGLSNAALTSQNVAASGTVWNYAAASILSGTTVNFGTVLKNTPLSQSLSISNTAPNDGFSEKLGAAFGSATGQAGGAGSWSLLSAGGTSTALNVTLASGSAGAASGSQTLNFTSDGAGTSGLSAVGIGSQTVSLSATVLDPAVASFMSGSTAQSTLTLDFLSVNQGDTVSPLHFNLFNLMQTAGYTADLALVSIIQSNPTGPLSTNLSLFNTLASGSFNSYQASVSTANQGTFSNTWTLQFRSSNANAVYTSDTLQTLTLTTNVIVVPEPGAIILAGFGIVAAVCAIRRRNK